MNLRPSSNTFLSIVALAFLIVVGVIGHSASSSAEKATVVAPPRVDEPAPTATYETSVFAGGCFWGIQGVFEHVAGVSKAVSGYTGGEASTARYEDVGLGDTGHAESVQVTYDPKKITYGQLLQIYFSVGHDPTQLNRQGPDRGTQYRSAIFPMNASQQHVADAYIAQINADHVFSAPLATTVEAGKTFYPAEAYHQDFLEHNRGYGYIIANDLPKLANLERVFPDRYRSDAAMVTPYPR